MRLPQRTLLTGDTAPRALQWDDSPAPQVASHLASCNASRPGDEHRDRLLSRQERWATAAARTIPRRGFTQQESPEPGGRSRCG